MNGKGVPYTCPDHSFHFPATLYTCSAIIYPFIPVVLSSVSTTYLLLVELNSLRTCTNATISTMLDHNDCCTDECHNGYQNIICTYSSLLK